MTIPNSILLSEPGLNEWCILSGFRGSIAHGTYRPNYESNSIDDKDVMAVCVPTENLYLSLEDYGSRGTREIMRDPWDIVIYEAKKFISMLEGANPNVLSLLWLESHLYMKKTPAGQLLLDNREIFATKRAYHSFVGYAHGQLHRTEHFAFKGYMGAKRKQLVEKFKFDTKNASHLIRILRMGMEFLIEGKLHVLRQDGPELLEIKDGKWSLEKVKSEADKLFALTQEAYIRSPLPAQPDRARVNQLCVDVIKMHWEYMKNIQKY